MITGVTVELFELLAESVVADLVAEVVKGFSHAELTVAAEFVVTGETVVTSALDVQRRQILGDEMRRPEEVLGQIRVQLLVHGSGLDHQADHEANQITLNRASIHRGYFGG